MKLISNKSDFGNIITKSDKPIIIDFYADWCRPCKLLTPILENLEKDYNNKFLFIKIDVDNEECNDIISLYEIKSMPTLLFIDHIKKTEQKDLRIEGFDKDKLLLNINKIDKIKT